jgi:hypothetical protein
MAHDSSKSVARRAHSKAKLPSLALVHPRDSFGAISRPGSALHSSSTITRFTPQNGRVSLPQLFAMWFIALAFSGSMPLAVAQSPLFLLANATVRTVAGRQGVTAPFSDGVGSAATFSNPFYVALNTTGAFALIVSRARG